MRPMPLDVVADAREPPCRRAPGSHEQVHRMAVRQQPADEVGADESRAAGD
jgi:hypothetical protein